ncbi:carbohydrate esterase [Corynebacterium phocae]|uniref:Carbohydrate esterase n=1 Tax=Corynebacterium phocae TaxID=161895 RepID=A0A1L7D5P8_9CORY|nr:cutinase family protein [Corynebacterium phocae]APT93397.1 carbohydrate esterase [Corynebacterium phocae]KAA8721739.1 cutinase family protein [Corynebacterium phocae]
MKRLLTVLAVLVMVGVIGGGAVQYYRATTSDDVAAPPPPPPLESSAPAAPAQPDWCPRVEFIAAPGTWESSPEDDPLNPQANPNSFMLSITNPLREAYDPADVKVWTLPYTAQFKNINAQQEMSYDESRDEGTLRLVNELKFMGENCPQTKFVLSGFSQGAVIVGDVADLIGAGAGPVPAASVAGVAIVADGRRETGVGQNPGVPVDGVGAEIALLPVNSLIQAIVPGATMRGPRTNGFGELADRTFQICAPNDTICDAPYNISNGFDRALDLIQSDGVHAMYANNPNVIPGTTANAWVVDWAHRVIGAQ